MTEDLACLLDASDSEDSDNQEVSDEETGVKLHGQHSSRGKNGTVWTATENRLSGRITHQNVVRDTPGPAQYSKRQIIESFKCVEAND